MRIHRPVYRKDDPSLPIHERIYQELEYRIKIGQLKVGDRLPSETDLVREFSVSRQPVRYALDTLEAAGLIYRAQGRGSFVRERMTGFSQQLREEGHQVSVHCLHLVEQPADEMEATKLDLPGGSPVIAIQRIYYTDNQPLAIFDIRLRPIIPVEILQAAGDFPSLYELLRSHGVEPWDAVETIGAQLLTAEDAELLGVASPAPALVIRRVSRLPNGIPVEYTRFRVRADRYEYSLHLGM